ncbi:MAG: hypothetical protein NTW06_03840 [Candidatus Falkowbacteria bacterium]|nr:hypothetical protein [Candidatus Falkowbacteria bacterium]
MKWEILLKPSIEKVVIFLILFTFLPWPREIYITPSFHLTFLFYGPVTLSEILSIPLQLGDHYASPEYMYGRLFSGQMIRIYCSFFLFLITCCFFSIFLSNKTIFFKATKIKTLLSFLILFLFFSGLLFFLLATDRYDNNNALALNIVIPLFLFSIFYIFYSTFQKILNNKLII